MLRDIISGKEQSQVLILRDSCQCNGFVMLKVLLSALSQRVDRVHLFLLEKLPDAITSLPQHVKNRLALHNISKDALGWDGNTDITMEGDFINYIKKTVATDQNIAIVFDCLSNLILHRGASYTCQVLHKCRTLLYKKDENRSPVVAVVHEDCHEDVEMNMICHTASTIIDLRLSKNESYSGSCHILHKKSSGKIVKSNEQYKMNECYDITEVEEMPERLLVPATPVTIAPDPTANLTFNLSLTQKEKEARSKVALPYLQKTESADVSISASGQIFYQADEADDFDEEDPDDDLDI